MNIPSVLGVIETLLAVAAYAWYTFRYGTAHLTLAVCVAPFLLLRTDTSVDRGLRWWDALWGPRWSHGVIGLCWLLGLVWTAYMVLDNIYTDSELLTLLIDLVPVTSQLHERGWLGPVLLLLAFSSPALVLLLLPATCIRFVATLFSLSDPARSFAAIPENWRRIALATDSTVLPELIPGDSGNADGPVSYHLLLPHNAFRLLRGKLSEERQRSAEKRKAGAATQWHTRLIRRRYPTLAQRLEVLNFKLDSAFDLFAAGLAYCVIVTALVVSFLPSLAYRWSMKGTAILLAPLLFLTRDLRRAEPRHVADSLLLKSVYNMAGVVVLVGLGRGILAATGVSTGFLSGYEEFVAQDDKHGIVKAFFPSDSVPLWQWMAFACAGLVVAVMWYATSLKNFGHSRSQKATLDVCIGFLGFLSVLLSLSLTYTAWRLAGSL